MSGVGGGERGGEAAGEDHAAGGAGGGEIMAEAVARFQRATAGVTQEIGSGWIRVGVGPIRLPVPDPGWMRWHDAHHVALGAGVDLRGEARVSAVDLRGRSPSPLIALLSLGALGLALLRWPRWAVGCWRAARGLRTLYHVPEGRLMAMTVAEARAEMGL